MTKQEVNVKAVRRRAVAYASLAELSSDLDRIEAAHRAGRLCRLGNHDAGPIFAHLAAAIRGSIDGFPAMKRIGPIWLHWLGPMVKKRVLSRPLGPGVRLSTAGERLAWDESVPFEKGLADLRGQIARLSGREASPGAPHPIFGKLSAEEWRTFHLRHAEMHLSFLRL